LFSTARRKRHPGRVDALTGLRATIPRALFAGWFLVVAANAQQPPPYEMLRQNEDWSEMRDPSRRYDWSDNLKYISLRGRDGWYASVGGEARPYYERYTNEDWGSAPRDSSGYMLQRYMLHGDFRFGTRFRFFGQIKSGIEIDKNGGPGPADEDHIDVHQAFIDVSTNANPDESVALRLGRQELEYGSARLISMREGPNVRRNFDGASLLVRALGWRIDSFFVKPVETDPGVFDDKAISSETLWALYAVRPVKRLGSNGAIDVYYIGLDRREANYQQGDDREKRHSVGTRFSGKPGNWDHDTELVYQFGTFGQGDLRAWTIAAKVGYTLSNTHLSPRLGLKADVTSGDRDPNDSDLQTFYPLFPKGAYFGQLTSVGPLNHRDLHSSLDLTFPAGLSMTADWVFYWRQSTRDALYGMTGKLARTGLVSGAREVGNQPGIEVRWKFDRHAEFTINYARFLAGPFLRETPPGEDITYFAAWLAYKF
jgi:hypothetical protein